AYNRPPTVVGRDELWLWGSGISGGDLLSSGFDVFLKKVPLSVGAWDSAPFEAQYLKLYDVTPPPSPIPLAGAYQLGAEVVFNWVPNGGPDDYITSFEITVSDGDGEVVSSGEVTDGSNQYSFAGVPGTNYQATLTAVSVAGVASTSPKTSSSVILLALGGDEDGDGRSNGDEDIAGTDPLAGSSAFQVTSVMVVDGDSEVTFSSVTGRYYHLEVSDDLGVTDAWTSVAGNYQAVGNFSTLTHQGGGGGDERFYRVKVTKDPQP
ncbi:MAG: hypothetical protein P8H96_06730, partial [Akkermansiaceae bacterium]|nr:hypothetical protein [Akkermansiaceae bacterium]